MNGELWRFRSTFCQACHRCANCPGDNNLREYLDGMFADSEEQEISFQQWQGTDRAMLYTQTTSIIEFLELLVDAISKLTVHLLQNAKQGT